MLTDGLSNPVFLTGNATETPWSRPLRPAAAPTLVAGAYSADLSGTYYIWYSYRISKYNVPTNLSPVASITVANQQINISNITLSTHALVDKIDVYASKVGEAIPYLLTTLDNTGTPTYTRTITDDSLIVPQGYYNGSSYDQPHGNPMLFNHISTWKKRIWASGTKYITTGIATVVNGSTSVTIATLSLLDSMVGMYISFGTNTNYYQIASVDTGAGTLVLHTEATEASDDYSLRIFGIRNAWLYSYVDSTGAVFPASFPFTDLRDSHYITCQEVDGEECIATCPLGTDRMLGFTNRNIYMITGDSPSNFVASLEITGHGTPGIRSFCKGPAGSVIFYDNISKDVYLYSGSANIQSLTQDRISAEMKNLLDTEFFVDDDSDVFITFNSNTDDVIVTRYLDSAGAKGAPSRVIINIRTGYIGIESPVTTFNVSEVLNINNQNFTYIGTTDGKLLIQDSGTDDLGVAITSTFKTNFKVLNPIYVDNSYLVRFVFKPTTARTGTLTYYYNGDYDTVKGTATVNFTDPRGFIDIPIFGRSHSLALSLSTSSSTETLTIKHIYVISKGTKKLV